MSYQYQVGSMLYLIVFLSFICHAKSTHLINFIGHFTQYLMNVNLKNYFVHNSRYFMMRRIDCAEM